MSEKSHRLSRKTLNFHKKRKETWFPDVSVHKTIGTRYLSNGRGAQHLHARCGGFNFPLCSVFQMTKYGSITSCDACAQQAKVVYFSAVLSHPLPSGSCHGGVYESSTTSGKRVDRMNCIFMQAECDLPKVVPMNTCKDGARVPRDYVTTQKRIVI